MPTARVAAALLVAVMLAPATLVEPASASAVHIDTDPDTDIGELTEQLRGADQQRDELEGQFDHTSRQHAAAEQELEALSSQLAQAEADLAELNADLARAEGDYHDALAAARSSWQDLARRAQAERRLARQLDEREQALEAQAVSAHKHGTVPRTVELSQAVLHAEDINTVTLNVHALRTVLDGEAATVAEVTDLRERTVHARTAAERATERHQERSESAEAARDHAAELAARQEDLTEQLADARDEQDELVAQLGGHVQALSADIEQTDEQIEELEDTLEEVVDEVSSSADGTVCPVLEGNFVNDWHFPRSGGRLHKGNDVFADEGSPLLAMHDGVVRRVSRVDRWTPGSETNLGGKTVSYWTESGTYWYFAHLDEVAEWVEPGERVRAGEQIGTVGRTGNARFTPPHVHIGYYPGGVAHNPYPHLRDACTP